MRQTVRITEKKKTTTDKNIDMTPINNNKLKSSELTDWSSPTEQQLWFDKFKSPAVADDELKTGLKFNRFRDFLKATLYTYFGRISRAGATNNATPTNDTNNHSCNENDHYSNNNNNTSTEFTYQQEMQLFKVFDSKNDHLIDRDEFANLCQNWLEKTFRRACALVVVDVQNDFIDGSLALINGPAGQDGAQVVPVINQILDNCKFKAVVYTQDWHPSDHIGFHDNLHLRKYSLKPTVTNQRRVSGSLLVGNQTIATAVTSAGTAEKEEQAKTKTTGENSNSIEKCQRRNLEEEEEENEEEVRSFKLKKLASQAKVFDIVLFDEGRMEQKLWPVHCIQNSWGAELHPKLKVVPNAIRIFKGTLSNVDAYSAFWDNMRLNETGLRQELIFRKISDVFFCGLALDYCVAASAIDSAKAGFTTFVIEDACRGLDEVEIRKRKDEMYEYGVLIVNTKTINNYLEIGNHHNHNHLHSGDDNNDEGTLARQPVNNCEADSTVVGSRTSHKNGPVSSSSCSPSFDHSWDEVVLLKNICFNRALALNAIY